MSDQELLDELNIRFDLPLWAIKRDPLMDYEISFYANVLGCSKARLRRVINKQLK